MDKGGNVNAASEKNLREKANPSSNYLCFYINKSDLLLLLLEILMCSKPSEIKKENQACVKTIANLFFAF